RGQWILQLCKRSQYCRFRKGCRCHVGPRGHLTCLTIKGFWLAVTERSAYFYTFGNCFFFGYMQITTKAIVLSSLKYGDTSLIVRALTESDGLKSYLLKGVLSSKKGKA